MKILEQKISKYWLIGIAITALLASSAVTAAVVAPIWSNIAPHQFTAQPWIGTVALVFPSLSSNIGQPIVLTATLNPTPNLNQLQQNVTFYYSTTSIAVGNNGNPTNQAQLNYVGIDQASSTVLSVNGIAHLSFTPSVTGTFYFIAEIITPT